MILNRSFYTTFFAVFGSFMAETMELSSLSSEKYGIHEPILTNLSGILPCVHVRGQVEDHSFCLTNSARHMRTALSCGTN
jgi:hypothetical protein